MSDKKLTLPSGASVMFVGGRRYGRNPVFAAFDAEKTLTPAPEAPSVKKPMTATTDRTGIRYAFNDAGTFRRLTPKINKHARRRARARERRAKEQS